MKADKFETIFEPKLKHFDHKKTFASFHHMLQEKTFHIIGPIFSLFPSSVQRFNNV